MRWDNRRRLTDSQILQARCWYETGEESLRDIAKQLGVSYETIRKYVKDIVPIAKDIRHDLSKEKKRYQRLTKIATHDINIMECEIEIITPKIFTYEGKAYKEVESLSLATKKIYISALGEIIMKADGYLTKRKTNGKVLPLSHTSRSIPKLVRETWTSIL